MKWDFCTGNPPYMEQNSSNNNMQPVYNYFIDQAYEIADSVELITPGRFLFDAGQTPKEWNRKILSDEHFKVLQYEADASTVFKNTEIKGGIAITYRSHKHKYGKIEVFTEYPELNSILIKTKEKAEESISTIVTGAVPYKFSKILQTENPDAAKKAGESYDLRTNIFEKLDNIIFYDKRIENEEYCKIYGLKDLKRTCRWIKKEYITVPPNFYMYKVLISKASNAGKFGEPLVSFNIANPNEGHTQSFISIGSFNTDLEAEHLGEYMKTKYFRTMLGILKRTPDLTPSKFKFVPLQDFTPSSDINWNTSIRGIDQQLYKKYGLSQEEIDFIEKNVKEME